jgi:hypothetical protein
MRCNKTDIYITRGDSGSFTVEIDLNKDFVIDEITFTVKKNPDSNQLIQKTLDSGITLLSSEISIEDDTKKTHSYKIRINSEDTENLNFGLYRYDVQINFTADEEENILTVIKPSIFGIEEEITGI